MGFSPAGLRANRSLRCLGANGRKSRLEFRLVSRTMSGSLLEVVLDHLNEGYRRVKLKIKPGDGS